MCRMTRGTVAPLADEYIARWLSNSSDSISGEAPVRILARLRQATFTGCGDFIELEQGYFFPQTTSKGLDDATVYVATGLRWAHGGPGLIAAPDTGGLNKYYDVGVFVGPPQTSGDVIDLT
jgi:hypothetical protein